MVADSLDDDLGRLIGTFYVSFPAIFFVSCVNAILADAVFFFPFFMGKRLNVPFRKVCAFGYVFINTVLFSTFSVVTGYNCAFGSDVCTVRLLHQRWCMASVAATTLSFLFFTLIDRVMEPLLCLSYGPYGHSLIKRWQHAAILCILWVCIAESDNLSVLLTMTVAFRRGAGSWAPLATRCITIGIKTYMSLIVVYTLSVPDCNAVLKKDVVAVSLLIAMF